MRRWLCVGTLTIVAIVAGLALLPAAGEARFYRGTLTLHATPDGWYWCAKC